MKAMTDDELRIFRDLGPYHPLRKTVLKAVLSRQDLASSIGAKEANALQMEYSGQEFSVMWISSLTGTVGVEHAEKILKLRSQLQKFYYSMCKCDEFVSLSDTLHSDEKDFWKRSFWMMYQLKFLDRDEISKEDIRIVLAVYKVYVKKLFDELKRINKSTSFGLVSSEDAQPLCTGILAVFMAVVTGTSPLDCIKKYNSNVAVMLVQFKNWLTGIFHLEDAFHLWERLPECIHYFDAELRQRLCIDIADTISQMSDQIISVEILNSACEDAVRKFVRTGSIVAVEQFMHSVFDMMRVWGVFRGEYQIVLKQLIERCRRLTDGN